MGLRDWIKRRVEGGNESAWTVSKQSPRHSATSQSTPSGTRTTASSVRPGAIVRRRWSDPPSAAVSVTWRPVTRGGEGGVPTWFGETLDPLTYDQVDVFNNRAEAKRRQTVLFPVAGTRYRPKVLDRPEFSAGQPVLLVPDPRNKHDRRAIEVRDAVGRQMVGFVPQDRVGEAFAQSLIHGWLAQGSVAALVISERAWTNDSGEPTSRRGGITVLAGPQLEVVDIPAQGDDEYAQFAAARLQARADAWPRLRIELRRVIDTSADVEDRHFAIQTLIKDAYRLRNAHPEALNDAITACHKQIDLAPRVAAVMRQRYDHQLPAHTGFKQLAIILEKQRSYTQAVDLVQQAQAQGWAGDWDKRLERLQRRLP